MKKFIITTLICTSAVMSNAHITIDYLSNHPELVTTCATWSYKEWGKYQPDRTLEDFVISRKEYLNTNKLPLTLVAFIDSKPVGMCSLTHNRGILPELTPWLATLYVEPEYRNKGIGIILEKAICDKAYSMKSQMIYCFSSDKNIIPWYEHHKWKIRQTAWLRDHEVTVMEKNLKED